MKNIPLPLVKIPEDMDTALFLIREELKIRQLFRLFEEIGMSDCAYRPNLDNLILKQVKIHDHTDEIFETYDKIMERRAAKTNGDFAVLTNQTLKAYYELVSFRKTLKEEVK